MFIVQLLAIALLLAGAFAALAQTPALGPGPAVSISAVTQSNPTNLQWTRVDLPYFRERIPQRSNGRVTVQGATFVERNLSGAEIIRLVRQGQVDIAGGTLATLSGDVPFLDALDLPGLNPTLEQLRRVVDASIPRANQELERFNTRIIATYPFAAQILFCRVPVASAEDLRGKRVRVFGPALNEFMTALGAQAVSIGFPEVYSALERGVVDCALTGAGSGNSARWTEVTTHQFVWPLGWAISGYFVNLQWWNRLDPAVRTFIEANFKEMEQAQWQLAQETTQDGIDCNAGRDSCRLHTRMARPLAEARAGAAENQALPRILAETILPNWVRRCGAACGTAFNETIAPVAGVRAP